MNEIDLRRKWPATATYDTRPVILMSASYVRKADLIAEVHRQARRGEVRPMNGGPSYNNRTGEWEIWVVRLRDPAPAWIRPAAITSGILAALGILVALGWWVLATVSAGPLLAFLAAAGIALAGIARAGRPRTVNITQNVRMR